MDEPAEQNAKRVHPDTEKQIVHNLTYMTFKGILHTCLLSLPIQIILHIIVRSVLTEYTVLFVWHKTCVFCHLWYVLIFYYFGKNLK